MNVFSEVKKYLTARQAAESYGLQIKRNGTACCPFHNDKHPSMKIDRNYHCFACGVGGDVINYVSRMNGLSQYEAALEPNSVIWFPLSYEYMKIGVAYSTEEIAGAVGLKGPRTRQLLNELVAIGVVECTAATKNRRYIKK